MTTRTETVERSALENLVLAYNTNELFVTKLVNDADEDVAIRDLARFELIEYRAQPVDRVNPYQHIKYCFSITLTGIMLVEDFFHEEDDWRFFPPTPRSG